MDAEYVRDGTELAIADMLTQRHDLLCRPCTCFRKWSAQTASAREDPRLHRPARAGHAEPVGRLRQRMPGEGDRPARRVSRRSADHDRPGAATCDWCGDETLAARAPRGRRAGVADDDPAGRGALARQPRPQALLSRLERLGLLSPLLTAVHAPELDDGEVERLSRVGASVVHCPRSAMKLGLGECPAAAFKTHSVNVALGTRRGRLQQRPRHARPKCAPLH